MDESVEAPDQPLVEYAAGKSPYNGRLDWRQWALFAVAVPIGTLALAAFIGIGVARQSSPVLVLMTPILLVYMVPMLAAFLVMRLRLGTFSLALAGWAGFLLAIIPVYFPGERADAIATGIAMIAKSAEWEDMARSVASPLEDGDGGLQGELISALRLTAPPDGRAVDEANKVVLAKNEDGLFSVTWRHGDGERVMTAATDASSPYVWVHPDRVSELSEQMGEAVEIDLDEGGSRALTSMWRVDELNLGGIALPGVLVRPCLPCSEASLAKFEGADLLLGENVLSALSWSETPERVSVNALLNANRRMDISPFIELGGRFARFPRGLVQVRLMAQNLTDRPIRDAAARITCGASTWLVSIGFLGAGESVQLRRRLPQHPKCRAYHFDLESASW